MNREEVLTIVAAHQQELTRLGVNEYSSAYVYLIDFNI